MPWMDLVEAINHDPPTKKEIEEVIDYRRRKAKPKFYADENLPTAAMRLIRSGGCNVLTANEVELQGHPDENPRRMLLRMLGCFSPAIVTI